MIVAFGFLAITALAVVLAFVLVLKDEVGMAAGFLTVAVLLAIFAGATYAQVAA